MFPEEELQALHHYPERKRVAAAMATSHPTENLWEAFSSKTTILCELTRMARLFQRFLVGGCKGGCRRHLPRTTSPMVFW